LQRDSVGWLFRRNWLGEMTSQRARARLHPSPGSTTNVGMQILGWFPSPCTFIVYSGGGSKCLFSTNRRYTSPSSNGSNDILPTLATMVGGSNIDLAAVRSMADDSAPASWADGSNVGLTVPGSTSMMATEDPSLHDEGNIPSRQLLDITSIHP
jgi:hypothetical protein